MKSIISISIFCMAFYLISCHQTPKQNINPIGDKIKTKADLLYTQVMDLHNETMAKYGKLLGFEKKATQKADSLKEVTKKCYCEGLKEQKAQYDSLLSHLKKAENSMNDWMGQFNAEPKVASEAEKINYFQDQKEKAQKMRDSFFVALGKADSLMGK